MTQDKRAPTVAHHQASADELLAWTSGHVEALEQLLAVPQLLPHEEQLVPLLRADLMIWRRVAILAAQEHARWSAGEAEP